MNDQKLNVIEKIRSLGATKQGVFIIIVSSLLFLSMLILNGNTLWNYSAPIPTSDYMKSLSPYNYSGVVGFGLNMSKWAIISLVGVAAGLVRIFVINKK